ncbi:MAG: hypothetical protein JWO25_288, partial [Alphaproteobacteria bacterium]|nr:hypothetical protein [Alphaproteobacteria bacterium]
MRRDCEADEIGRLEGDPVVAAGMVEPAVRAGDGEEDIIALALEPHPFRGGDIRHDLAGRSVLRLAILERDQAIAVNHDIGIRRAGTQTLSDHQPGLAMRIGAFADPVDIRGDLEIAGTLGPDKVEG